MSHEIYIKTNLALLDNNKCVLFCFVLNHNTKIQAWENYHIYLNPK